MSALDFIRRYRRDEHAVAAIEFAVAMPFLLILMLSGIQLVTYTNATRRVELVASSVSEMISQKGPPPGNNASTWTVNASDVSFSTNAALLIFPYLMADARTQNLVWTQLISINYSSIQFTAIPSKTCTGSDQSACYVANVVWTSSGTAGNRPCVIPQLAADDTAAPTNSTLPRSVFGPGSIIAVDIVYNFKPTFGSGFLPTIRIARSVYVQPRYVTLLTFDMSTYNGMTTECPGY